MNHLLATHVYAVIQVLMYTRVSHVVNAGLWDINIQLCQKVVQGLYDKALVYKKRYVHKAMGRK